MTDEEKKQDESNFRNSTAKAISALRASNKKLTDESVANKKKTLAANRKKKKDAKRKYVSDKYTKIAGLQGLQGLQPLTTKKTRTT
jgi:hypothetical protein